jgi:hypothetical protein
LALVGLESRESKTSRDKAEGNAHDATAVNRRVISRAYKIKVCIRVSHVL